MKKKLAKKLEEKLARNFAIQLGNKLGDELWPQLWAKLRRDIWSRLEDQFDRKLGNRLTIYLDFEKKRLDI